MQRRKIPNFVKPPTACSSTRTRPLPVSPPSDWPRLHLSQNFACINTLAISFQLFFMFKRPMKMEQSVPKRRHIKFRRRGITQKKEHNIRLGNLYEWRDVTTWEPRKCFVQLLVEGDGPEDVLSVSQSVSQSVGQSASYPDSQVLITLNLFVCLSPPLSTFPQHTAESVWPSNEIKNSVRTELRSLFATDQEEPFVCPC